MKLVGKPAEVIHRRLRQLYDKAKDKDGRVVPDLLATKFYGEMDKKKRAPALVKFACLEYLKAEAADVCRNTFRAEEEAAESEQGQLWDYKLQPMYPVKRDGMVMYIPRNEMTVAERRKNANRLRHEARQKNRHADALDAETDELIRLGTLKPEPNQNPKTA